jgi:hypothetical protein
LNPLLHLLYHLRIDAEAVELSWHAIRSVAVDLDQTVQIAAGIPISAEQDNRLIHVATTRGYKGVRFPHI